MQNKNIEKKEVELPGGTNKSISNQEKPEAKTEARLNIERDRNISEALKREVELLQADDLREEAKTEAEKIKFLGEKEKLNNLLGIAKKRGVAASVQTAKELNEPYILDALHDILAKKGYYKEFTE